VKVRKREAEREVIQIKVVAVVAIPEQDIS